MLNVSEVAQPDTSKVTLLALLQVQGKSYFIRQLCCGLQSNRHVTGQSPALCDLVHKALLQD